jgi:hypothetical protein
MSSIVGQDMLGFWPFSGLVLARVANPVEIIKINNFFISANGFYSPETPSPYHPSTQIQNSATTLRPTSKMT